MDRSQSNIEEQRQQLMKYDKDKTLDMLNDDYIHTFKNQIKQLKEHLD